jgi:hypothetical protein
MSCIWDTVWSTRALPLHGGSVPQLASLCIVGSICEQAAAVFATSTYSLCTVFCVGQIDEVGLTSLVLSMHVPSEAWWVMST